MTGFLHNLYLVESLGAGFGAIFLIVHLKQSIKLVIFSLPLATIEGSNDRHLRHFLYLSQMLCLLDCICPIVVKSIFLI